MKTNYKIEKQINTRLSALAADSRPECLLTGQRVQSVAYNANGYFECRTTNGHIVLVDEEKAKTWIAK